MKLDDPFSLAEYAVQNGLLGKDGWKSLQRFAKNKKKLIRMTKIMKAQMGKTQMYKYGIEVPYSYKRALAIDKETGTTSWHLSMKKELDDIDSYSTFENMGRISDGAQAPKDHQRVRVHFVYDIKPDGRRKSRLVAGGNMLDPPKDITYAGVATMRSIRLVTFLAEHNNMNLIGLDVGNAYLTSRSKEQCFVIGGPEFSHGSNTHEGCILRVVQALYGLRSSGASFHDSFADSLRGMNFFGDNKGVVDSSTIPHSKLAKRWNALSYHRVREAIAAKYVVFLHLDGKKNPSDICTKLLKHIDMKDFVVPLMSFKSDVGVQHPTGAIQQMTHRVILHYYPSVGVVGVQGPDGVMSFKGNALQYLPGRYK
jgi:hypothetical protein